MGLLPHIVENCQGIVQVYSDGTITRTSQIDLNIPIHDDGSAVWKDLEFHSSHKLRLRLYKPASANPESNPRLPILFYIHGGGFCLGSCSWPNFHNCCLRLSSRLQAVVVSPDYRLAPEHPLPAAIDDSLSALKWLQSQALGGGDVWLSSRVVDFDRVFILGDSSGGNIAHHVAVRTGSGLVEFSPIQVRGYVLLAPFFGGSDRTASELGPPEGLLNLDILDRFWRLSLPAGETTDHPWVNPFGPRSPNLEEVTLGPMLVLAGGNELLKDRVEEYANKLKDLGKNVKYVEFLREEHGFLTNDPYSKVSNKLLNLIHEFMSANSN
ncbi:Alpha/beta hydrolase fold-3 [Dillenia turbinata]|uniref:Alpha/beta hydrolase fold-3 n=1 Tax=Dillenia turbinata TaxID=194707 RepID=A0AAN8W6K3_9MAGN